MLQQPANQQHIFTVPLPKLEDISLPVIKQVGSEVWLNKSNHPLVLTKEFIPGRLVALTSTTSATGKGIILNKANDEAVVIQAVDFSLTYTTGKLLNWWSIQRPQTEWLNKSTALVYASGATAVFQALCVCPPSYENGLITWSLYYQQEPSSSKEEIAKGNDFSTPRVCTISLESHKWKAGIYTLKANRLQAKHLMIVKSDIRVWEVSNVTSLISVGYALDYLPPLYLS